MPVAYAGIYAVASLHGQAIHPEARTALGFGQAALPGELRLELPGFAVRLWDVQASALDLVSSPREVIAFAGYLDEPEALAGSLGLPAETCSGLLAGDALRRFGADAPDHMLGEWTVLRWEPEAHRLTLQSSRARRDLIYFMERENWIAIAPDAMLLGRLTAGGLRLDPPGLALNLARRDLRERLRDRTLWEGVRCLEPGVGQTLSPAGRESSFCRAQEQPERWTGSFSEAVEMLNGVGRRIMLGHLARSGRTAFYLSGGQDSTLLTAWGAGEQGSWVPPLALTSVAPPGSGLADESAFSQAAAQQLELAWKGVWPDEHDDLFRPPTALFGFHQSPLVGGRAPVYSALRRAALQAGANIGIDGALGEETLTGGHTLPAWSTWSSFLDALRRWKHRERTARDWPADAFHLRLSPALLAEMPEASISRSRRLLRDPEARGLIGISRVVVKGGFSATAECDSFRRSYPFRDRRLVAAAACLPLSFQTEGGVTRALSRACLQGLIPEEVRLRTIKLPFSPDFLRRLQRQAPAAQARVALYRKAGLGRWLDLDWLTLALGRLQVEADLSYGVLFTTQQTAVAAEFLLWAREQGAADPLA